MQTRRSCFQERRLWNLQSRIGGKKAEPLVKKIVQVMSSVYLAYLDISNKFTKLQAVYNRERSENKLQGENLPVSQEWRSCLVYS